MSKAQLFEILDSLEKRTLPIMEKARARLAQENAQGAAALEPWNISQALAGDATRALDPYFPFENAVDVWARSFAALGLTYSGGGMVLDLCDRAGKSRTAFARGRPARTDRPTASLFPRALISRASRRRRPSGPASRRCRRCCTRAGTRRTLRAWTRSRRCARRSGRRFRWRSLR